jgi:hypothetical protein
VDIVEIPVYLVPNSECGAMDYMQVQFYAISLRHFGISAPQPDFNGFDYFDLLGPPTVGYG